MAYIAGVEIDMAKLSEKAGESSYWRASEKFVNDIADKEESGRDFSLSYAQESWLVKIETDLDK